MVNSKMMDHGDSTGVYNYVCQEISKVREQDDQEADDQEASAAEANGATTPKEWGWDVIPRCMFHPSKHPNEVKYAPLGENACDYQVNNPQQIGFGDVRVESWL